MKATKGCILAGDPYQLSPTVKSDKAKAQGLGISLLERLMHHPSFVHHVYLLNTQYRMNAVICDWISVSMYDSKLVSHESVANKSLNNWETVQMTASNIGNELKSNDSYSSAQVDGNSRDIDSVVNRDVLTLSYDAACYSVLTVVDTSGCSDDSQESSTLTGSHYNEYEALCVYRYVMLLLKLGVSLNDIGVITPYNGQVTSRV